MILSQVIADIKSIAKISRKGRSPFVGLYTPPKTREEYEEIMRVFVER